MFCPSFCCITVIYYCVLTELLMLLFIAGDIERNPVPPFNIVKSVKGSCHQGDIKFSDTAGMQCTCNSLFAICFSKMYRISLWRSEDLDLVLKNCDFIYKKLNITGTITFIDVPNTVHTENGASFKIIKLRTQQKVNSYFK